MGRLTTHVLDIAQGKPGAGMLVELYALERSRRLLASIRTNDDGRADKPLIEGKDFAIGQYELVFHAGDYFKEAGLATASPPFLDEVPIRFAIASADSHYHVPLLVSPWAYSTYRGS